ncbi:MAG: HlyD family efflux transporter periplasmic adaptor subunit, partial [Planctomycetia bacterium]|nr:HlyD family efflux transporter periplasmic adaptor subunit [Planctomycetia bacterium]
MDGTVQFRSQEALDRTGIEVQPVEQRPMVSELVVNGVVAYDERRIAQLSTRVPGSIWRVEKHLGDHVRRGDVLLVIDSQDVGQLKAEFLNALVVHETRREQLAILEEVKSAVMGRQLREARAALREARNHLVNAEQSLVNLGFDIAVADFEPLDDDARAAKIRTLGLPPTLTATLPGDRMTSNLLPLYAPFDGIVVGREAVVGEVIEAAKPIFEVADVSTMLLVLNVSKEDAAKVAIGQRVKFRPDGSSEEYASTITWISTEVNEETRTLQVRAEVQNDAEPLAAARGLRANTYGAGRIEVDRRGTAVVVPRQSVQWDGSRWVVFVPAGEASELLSRAGGEKAKEDPGAISRLRAWAAARAESDLISRLEDEPWQFDFFTLIRRMEAMHADRPRL